MHSKSSTSAADMDCQTCQAHLADYVHLELSGQAAEAAYPALALHVETCDRCQAAYYREFRSQGQLKSVAELRQIGERSQVAEAMQRILAAPQAGPAPDPSWYQVAWDHGRAWLERETDNWRQVWLTLGNVMGGQTPALAPVGIMADGAKVPAPSQATLTLAPDQADFELKLVVVPEPTSVGDGLCRVEVALTLKDRFGDFSGAQVTLLWGDQTFSQETDVLGKVVFSGLPCDQVPAMSLTLVLPE